MHFGNDWSALTSFQCDDVFFIEYDTAHWFGDRKVLADKVLGSGFKDEPALISQPVRFRVESENGRIVPKDSKYGSMNTFWLIYHFSVGLFTVSFRLFLP